MFRKMSLTCIGCQKDSEKEKHIVYSINCFHNYCFDCLNMQYNDRKGQCVSPNCKKKITKKDFLPFLSNISNNLFDNKMTYKERIKELDKYFNDNIHVLKNTLVLGNKIYILILFFWWKTFCNHL